MFFTFSMTNLLLAGAGLVMLRVLVLVFSLKRTFLDLVNHATYQVTIKTHVGNWA